MTTALLLSGSPRGKKSNSESVGTYLLQLLEKKGLKTKTIIIRPTLNSEEKIKEMVASVKDSDIIILTAPLYDDCQPYIVTKTMEILADSKLNFDKKQFIPIINCGLPEPHHISAVAISIYKRFADMVGLQWVGSLAIGGGGGLQGDRGLKLEDAKPFSKNAIKELEKISDSLTSDTVYSDVEIILVPGIFYKWPLNRIMTSLNTKAWKKMAEKKGEKVDAKPYLET